MAIKKHCAIRIDQRDPIHVDATLEKRGAVRLRVQQGGERICILHKLGAQLLVKVEIHAASEEHAQ